MERYSIVHSGHVDLGKAFLQDDNRTSVSIGPVHKGRFVAKLWRFWAQGDEFYAAQRDAVKVTKISFHSGGNWHYDIGKLRKQLAPPRQLSIPGWGLALQLTFLVHEEIVPSPLLTKIKPSASVIGAEVPLGHKLVLNLLTAPDGTTLNSPAPAEMDGIRILCLRLRSHGAVMLNVNVQALVTQDFELIEAMKQTTTKFTAVDPKSKPMAELMHVTFDPQWNLILVVPFREQCFVWDGPPR